MKGAEDTVQYQTFRGVDVNDAMKRVNAALGPNAVIQSTRHVNGDRGDGWSGSFVEITALNPRRTQRAWPFSEDVATGEAVPRHGAMDRRRLAGNRGAVRIAEPRHDDTMMDLPPAGDFEPEISTQQLDRELRALRAMLDDLNAARPPKERALSLLYAAGIDGRIARELASGIGRSSKSTNLTLRSRLIERVRGRLPLAPGLILGEGRRIVACVGPTGAGKTTTLAKLAAKARLDHGRSVGVISLDTFRVGAVEQWQRYSQLIGVRFQIARTPAEFERGLRSSTSDLVLVDTSGRGARDDQDSWPLAACLPLVTTHPIDTLVVLPAWLRGHDAEQVIRTYADVRPSGVVITKTDEATQYGGVIQSVLTSQLPITYVCDGARVPEDINDADADTVLTGLFAERS